MIKPARCRTVNLTTGICSVCNSGLVRIVQGNDVICVTNVVNCSLYDATLNTCIQCRIENFIPVSNSCIFFTRGCATRSTTNPLLCQNCSTTLGYFLKDGYCILDRFCQTLSPTGICTECVPGYRFLNTFTYYCTKNTIDNCSVQVGDDCQQCNASFTKISIKGKVSCIKN